jgi:hypothetical protein
MHPASKQQLDKHTLRRPNDVTFQQYQLSCGLFSVWSSLLKNRTVFSVHGLCGGYIMRITAAVQFSSVQFSSVQFLVADSHKKFVEDL